MVKKQDKAVDNYDTVVGIREIKFDADKGFLLTDTR